MKSVPLAEVKADLNSYVEQSQEEPVVITQNGRPVAVLISVLDEDELERLVLAHTPRFDRLLEAAQQRIRETGGIEHEDFWASVEKQT